MHFPFLFAVVAATIDWHDPSAVVAAALAVNPSIARMQSEIAEARERATAVASLPNPMVMGGIQNQPIDLSGDPMRMITVGASQQIPRKAKRDAERRRADLEIRKLELTQESLRAEIERDVLFAWYDVAAIDGQLRAVSRIRESTTTLVAAARARYEVGSAVQADLIRAELEVNDLEHQTLSLQGQRRVIGTRLLALLDLPMTSEIPTLHADHGMTSPDLSGPVSVAQTNPAIAALQAEVDERTADLDLAKLAYRPDWSIEADYGVRPGERDMISVVTRVELPWRKQNLLEPRIREAIAARDTASHRIEELRRRLLQDMAAAAAIHDAGNLQIALHESKLVPLAKLGLESALASYQSGKNSFESVLEAATASLRLETDYYAFAAQHIKAVTDFEALKKGARFGAMTTSASPGM